MLSQGLAARLAPPVNLDSSSTAQASQPVFQVATGMIEECLVEVDPAVAWSGGQAVRLW